MKYCGFLSYSHRDARVAKRLHRALERYRLPKEVAGGRPDRRLGRFFRDQDELPGATRLGAALEGALADSQSLIVIASPDAARSEWVNAEVRYFQRREGARVLAFIVRGRPDADDPEEQCFPPALRFEHDEHGRALARRADPPLAPELAKEGFEHAFVRLVAGLVGASFDDLWQREKRRQRRRRALVASAASAVTLGALASTARIVAQSDSAALRAHSIELSTARWQRFREGSAFDAPLRAALGAITLAGARPRDLLDPRPDEAPALDALRVSGRALPWRRVFGEHPDLSTRSNFRDDIPGASASARVAVRAGVEMRGLGFSGDTRKLALCGNGGNVVVIDLQSGARCYEAQLDRVDVAARIALDEDGSTAVVATSGCLHVVNVLDRSVTTLQAPELASVHEVQKTPAGWLLAARLRDRTVVCEFDIGAARLGNSTEIPVFTPYFANALARGPLRFVAYDELPGLTPVDDNGRVGESVKFDNLAFGVGQVKALAVDGAGDLVALGGNGSGGGDRAGVQVVSLARRCETARFVGHTGEVYALDFMPGANLIASCGSDFSVRLWRSDSAREVLRLAGHVAEVGAARFSPDGSLLATSSPDGMVLLWDTSCLRGELAAWSAPQSVHSAWEFPSSVLTAQERTNFGSLHGRPWDLRDWRSPDSVAGCVQSLRALAFRTLRWSWLDYAQPDASGE